MTKLEEDGEAAASWFHSCAGQLVSVCSRRVVAKCSEGGETRTYRTWYHNIRENAYSRNCTPLPLFFSHQVSSFSARGYYSPHCRRAQRYPWTRKSLSIPRSISLHQRLQKFEYCRRMSSHFYLLLIISPLLLLCWLFASDASFTSHESDNRPLYSDAVIPCLTLIETYIVPCHP